MADVKLADRDVVIVLPSLGPGGSERVATILLNAWRRDGRRATLVTLSNDPPDAYRLESGIERVRLPDVLRARQSPSCRPGRSGRASLPAAPGRSHPRSGRPRRARARRPHRGSAPRTGALPGGVLPGRCYGRSEGLRQLLREARPRIVIGFLGSANVTAILAARPLDLPVVISERNDPAIEELSAPWQHLRERTYRWADARHGQQPRGAGHDEGVRAGVEAGLRAEPGCRAGGRAWVSAPREPDHPCRGPARSAEGLRYPAAGLRGRRSGHGGMARGDPGGWTAAAGAGAPRRDAGRPGIASSFTVMWTIRSPHYARASMFVLPSRFEGMPNALLEAMASGLPAVVSDASPGPLEEVTDGENGLVVPAGDATALTRAMTRLAGDADRAPYDGGSGTSAIRRARSGEDVGRVGSGDGAGAPRSRQGSCRVRVRMTAP